MTEASSFSAEPPPDTSWWTIHLAFSGFFKNVSYLPTPCLFFQKAEKSAHLSPFYSKWEKVVFEEKCYFSLMPSISHGVTPICSPPVRDCGKYKEKKSNIPWPLRVESLV